MENDFNNPLLDVYQEHIQKGLITHDPAQELILQILYDLGEDLIALKRQGRSLLDRLRSHRNLGAGKVQGIYIYGNVGRGKSMLMDLFFMTLPVRRKRRVHFHAFMLDIHARLNQLKQDNLDETNPIITIAEQVAKESWLLCFDEFQVTDIADAMILGRLFEQLFDRGVVVVATSNRHPDDLYKNGLQRQHFLPFIELFKTKLTVLSLDGNMDYRLQHLQSLATTYFTPLGTESDQFLQGSFAELTQDATSSSTSLDIQGRKLEVSRSYGDIAWFSFDELCARPLGAADYIAIAREFGTVLLSDIPLLSPENRNEAKRFVTLIDELYEHKVKLICTAETIPQKLYPEGDESFEFQRTISRLMEMQSESYLQDEHIS